jgi:hypothetical protein
MDCKQFREVLDSYIDGELSPDAAAAADVHRRECWRCHRIAGRLLSLRLEVKRAVGAGGLPPRLEARVRSALYPRWTGRWPVTAPRLPLPLAAAAVVLVVVTLSAAALGVPVAAMTASALDRLAVRLDETRSAVVPATVLCRDCELEHRYGVESSCRTIGHHGALATADGRIWNIVEQRASADLVHDNALLGRRVQVRAQFFRRAGAVEIESYRFDDGPQTGTALNVSPAPGFAKLEPFVSVRLSSYSVTRPSAVARSR